jgi:hypothetical protein
MSSAWPNFSAANQATIEDAKTHTVVKKDIDSPFGHAIPECVGIKFKDINTHLGNYDPNDWTVDDAEKFEFHNYFSEDCWIIGEVFKKADAAAFHLSEIISIQLTKAGVVKRNPRVVILKNVVHDPIVQLALPQGTLTLANALNLIKTPLFKAIDRVVMGRILEVEKLGENHIKITFSQLG